MKQNRRLFVGFRLLLAGFVACLIAPPLALPGIVAGAGPALANPIMFVTQVPVVDDFTTITAVFGNHQGLVSHAPRGGDLWIRYPDGSLKNLTETAGYGVTGFQDTKSITVRDPSVHWSGKKALFSMVIGGATEQYQDSSAYWQIYEVSRLGQNDTPVITKISNQPEDFNNITPIYGTDDRIIFTSDRPRSGARHLYPQLDEYELTPTVTGIWSMDPKTGDLFMLNHAPSGAFSPRIDSDGRIVFTRWDHLQRDQQADADAQGDGDYGTFNYGNEDPDAPKLNNWTEYFPEPRSVRTDLLPKNVNGLDFNLFQPWEIREDGTGEQTLHHIGRHELQDYFDQSFNNDAALEEHYSSTPRTNQNSISNMLQTVEMPNKPGVYIGTDAPEFATRSAGQLVALTFPQGKTADDAYVTYLTDRATAGYRSDDERVPAQHSGLYRDPLPMSDGRLVAVHTPETRADNNDGTAKNPKLRYDFLIKTLKQQGQTWVADEPLTAGISKKVEYWSPEEYVAHNGRLWELQPVEVRSRNIPSRLHSTIEAPEAAIFSSAGVDVSAFMEYLKTNDLAVAVTRNITTRDGNDRQQPFNLRVPSGVQTRGGSGKVYDVSFLQFFQGDQIRGWGGILDPYPGRRVLAQPLHSVSNQTPVGAPTGSVQIAPDGSTAALVPARRALTWQVTDSSGAPVVRERYWVTFQPGEIRVCASCHGVNAEDQAHNPPPTNTPQALLSLVKSWKEGTPLAP